MNVEVYIGERDDEAKPDAVPHLQEDVAYEECPTCKGGHFKACLTCWDEGLVPHGCDSALVEYEGPQA
jgi:hypothetical protein